MNDEPQTTHEPPADTWLACSVIVPSYRSKHTIAACLHALLRQDIGLPYEIIVVDSSPDETPSIVRRTSPDVRLVHLARQTDPALARNIGAEQARGDVLAFIDSDCIAPADWLRRLYAILQRGYHAAGGAIANGNGDSLVSWAGYMCEFREFLPGGAPRDVENLTLGNAAYRRASYWSVGGIPADCFPQEDQVFHQALRSRGMRIHLDPRIAVAHTHRTERRAFLDHQRRIGRANARVLRQLDRPEASLASDPRLALVALPALIPLRFSRTIRACRGVEGGLVFRQPALLWLCWLGMCWWGRGFLEGARTHAAMPRGIGRADSAPV